MNFLLGVEDKAKYEAEQKMKKFMEDNSDDSEEEEKRAKQENERLQNKQQNQAKLFGNTTNFTPNQGGANLVKPKNPAVNQKLTKEVIMEKFGEDFDACTELPELNEQKKQIMLNKMRKTINKMSSLRIQKHMDSELRQMIEIKIEELKKIKGANYNKIANTVEELILSLKQPDYYFADDEDVTQITDVQEPYNIEPRKDIDFAALMGQSDTTNEKN